MESISELRNICQSTRPSIFTDFLSAYYYRVAIYFTRIFLLLGFSANQVTIFSGFTAAMGGVLLSFNEPVLVFLGCMCFHLFAIFDMCDGEVARYRGTGGLKGHYLDWYMHYLTPSFFIVGVFFASISYLTMPLLMLIGMIAVFVPVLDKSVESAGWTVIVWTRMRNFNKGERSKEEEKEEKKEEKKEEVSSSPSYFNTQSFSDSWLWRRFKFIAMAPFQDHWAPSLLMLLAIFGLVLEFYSVSIPYTFFWLMYVGLVGPFYIWSRVRQYMIKDNLENGYKKIFFGTKEYRFPEDDFLG